MEVTDTTATMTPKNKTIPTHLTEASNQQIHSRTVKACAELQHSTPLSEQLKRVEGILNVNFASLHRLISTFLVMILDAICFILMLLLT